jgi:hypothetical protein
LNPQPPSNAYSDHRPRTGWGGAGWLLGGLFMVSVAVGIMGWLRFTASEQELTTSIQRMAQRGSQLTPTQCIDAVLAWRIECTAMKNLCDASVYRMMESCLAGADRRKYCAENEAAMSATSFGYGDCAQRGLDRGGKKACAAAYRALDAYCKGSESQGAEKRGHHEWDSMYARLQDSFTTHPPSGRCAPVSMATKGKR